MEGGREKGGREREGGKEGRRERGEREGGGKREVRREGGRERRRRRIRTALFGLCMAALCSSSRVVIQRSFSVSFSVSISTRLGILTHCSCKQDIWEGRRGEDKYTMHW